MLAHVAELALPTSAYFMQESRKDKSCNKYTYGKFYFGDNLASMPSCESYIEDTVFDKIKDWFNNLSGEKTNEEKQKEEKKKEDKREEKKEDRKQKKKRFRLFGRQ